MQPQLGLFNVSRQLIQRANQAVDLFGRVVMHHADPEEAALSLEPQPLRETECIHVAISDEDLARCQVLGQFGRASVASYGDRRHAPG